MIIELAAILFVLYVIYQQYRMHRNTDVQENNPFELPVVVDGSLSDEEHAYYQECKEYYHVTNKPLLSVSDEILHNDTESISAVVLQCGIDEDYDTFDVQLFLTRLCQLLQLNRADIRVTKIQKGSCFIDISIDGEKHHVQLTVKNLYTLLTNEIDKELAKLKVFFLYMGKDLKHLYEKQKFRKEIRLNPSYNRIYDVGHTHWTGPLEDGRDRGKYAYFCPIGWKRYAFYVTDNYHDKFKGWPIGYHGTKFEYGLSILLSGLAPARCAALGQGIYASQSIIYTAHPRYAEVKEIQSSSEANFFKKGSYVQFVLHCRINPNSIYVVGPETLCVGNQGRIDANVPNSEIEWVIDPKGKKLVDFNDPDANIVCTGLMIRVTDNHPCLLPESKWWKWTPWDTPKHIQNRSCNIIYE